MTDDTQDALKYLYYHLDRATGDTVMVDVGMLRLALMELQHEIDICHETIRDMIPLCQADDLEDADILVVARFLAGDA